MILIKLEELMDYEKVIPNAKEILSIDFNSKKEGKYKLKGDSFYFISNGDLRKNSTYEVHEKYIDLHIPLDNVEGIKFALHKWVENMPIDKDKDVSWGFVESNESFCAVEPGEVAIYMPGEPHAPLIHVTGKKSIRKAVIKIAK